MIGIIDLGVGNIGSIKAAIYNLGFEIALIEHKDSPFLERITHMVLPGVGSFRDVVGVIKAQGFEPVIRSHVDSGRPLLGVCAGMQILSTVGFEPCETEGLSLVAGRVSRLSEGQDARVPHVGWNNVSFEKAHPVLRGVAKDVDFYFVHSYYYSSIAKNNIIATASHGENRIPAIIVKENIIGIQFHPEKSQKNGLKILENFCDWSYAC